MKFPIRIRLAVASCTVFLVVIAALELVAYISVRAAIRNIVDHELDTRLAGLDDHIARHVTHFTWPQLSEQLRAHPAFQPALLRIQSDNGDLLMEGTGLRGVSIPHSSRTIAFATTGYAGRSLRVLTVTRTIEGATYHLTLATDLFFAARILGRLWLLMFLTVPLVLLISGGAGYWISGRALAPVSRIIAAARSIDTNHLSERIAAPATGDEIQRLAETVNGMLARIESGVQQMRQFTADASHELRTPLAIIRANAEVALLDESDRSGRSLREALHRILKEAERDSALLEHMLSYVRAGAQIDPAPRKTVDLSASLSAACSDIRPLAAANQLELHFRALGHPHASAADEEQLRRLWFILLDNAVKFTPPGGSITAVTGIADNGRAFVAVSDTGQAIPPQYHARIFEPFFRVDKARSRSQGGAGLGLAIARQIAVAHHATLELDSEPGVGSRFTVTFPAGAVHDLRGRDAECLRPQPTANWQ